MSGSSLTPEYDWRASNAQIWYTEYLVNTNLYNATIPNIHYQYLVRRLGPSTPRSFADRINDKLAQTPRLKYCRTLIVEPWPTVWTYCKVDGCCLSACQLGSQLAHSGRAEMFDRGTNPLMTVAPHRSPLCNHIQGQIDGSGRPVKHHVIPAYYLLTPRMPRETTLGPPPVSVLTFSGEASFVFRHVSFLDHQASSVCRRLRRVPAAPPCLPRPHT